MPSVGRSKTLDSCYGWRSGGKPVRRTVRARNWRQQVPPRPLIKLLGCACRCLGRGLALALALALHLRLRLGLALSLKLGLALGLCMCLRTRERC